MFNGWEMFLKLKYLFNSKQIDNFWICSSVQIINSVPFSRLLKYSLSSIRVPSENKNRWRLSALIISLAWRKRWSMFSTGIRILSIWLSNGFLKWICFHRFYLKPFSLQNIYSVCNFPSMKSPPWNWMAFYQNSFVTSPGSLYHLIRRDSGRLANEVFTSNPIVSSKE